MGNKVFFSVYNTDGKHLGYKTDSFWSTDLERYYAKTHPIEDARLDSAPFKNLYWLLSEKRKSQKKQSGESYSLHVVVEDAKTERVVGGLHVFLQD